MVGVKVRFDPMLTAAIIWTANPQSTEANPPIKPIVLESRVLSIIVILSLRFQFTYNQRAKLTGYDNEEKRICESRNKDHQM